MGRTCHLRPLAEDDWAALFQAASDPQIWEYHPATDRWQEYSFRRFFDASIACGSAMLISDSKTGEVIGTSRFDVTRAQANEAEIGWTFLIRSRWAAGTTPP